MEHACVSCGKVLPEISEKEFFSEESKQRTKAVRGVRFVEDAYAEEIHGDSTKNWECEICWWEGWWDI